MSPFLRCIAIVAALQLAPAASWAQVVSSRPLGPPGPSSSGTLFNEVPRSWSGLDDRNDFADPSMWRDRFLEFSLGALGTGVAIGDFDRDGLADLFVVSKTEANCLFRNLGEMRFENVTESAGLSEPDKAWCQGAAFVDYDNDGWLDIYVCRFDAPNLLYRNNGDGTFDECAEEAGVAVVDASGMASFADYDRDGLLDFYLLTNLLSLREGPSGQEDYLFRNRGDGTFEDVTKAAGVAGPGQGHSATWLDYNQDGWLDLYVANDFTPPDSLYHNAGDGTFVEALSLVVPHTPNSSMGADIVDLNRDGLIDFMVGDMAARAHEKDMRGMVDGREEAADPRSDYFAAQQYPRNSVYINSGMGPFLEGAHLMGLDATDWTWSLRFEDLDNDGWDDLHVTTGMIRELHGTDLMRRMRAAPTPAAKTAIVKSSPPLDEANLVYRNRGDYRFEESGADWGLDATGISFGAAFGDLDGDGDLDLVHSNYEKGVTLMRNDSSEGNRLMIELEGVASNRYGIGAIVTLETESGSQTKPLSLSRGYMSSSEPVLHFGVGEETAAARAIIVWPSGKRQVLEGLEKGFRYRVREPETDATKRKGSTTLQRRVWFNERSRDLSLLHRVRERILFERKRQPLLPRRHNRLGPAVAVGEIDAQGMSDVLVGGTPFVSSSVFFRREGKAFHTGGSLKVREAPLNDGPLLLFDADGDGHDDALITGGGAIQEAGHAAYQPRLLLNDGQGNFIPSGESAFPAFPVSAGAAAAADFDRDGDLDLFLGGRVVPGHYPSVPQSGLFINDGGRFRNVTAEFGPALVDVGMVSSALWSDADDDGWVDLLVAVEWGGVRYFRNRGGLEFVEASQFLGFESGGTGWWNSIAAADFNRDGRVDYAVGNLGLNTAYEASPKRPALLFHGAHPAVGGETLVEARYEGDRLLPVRGRAALSKRFPDLLKRFPSNNAFAQATLHKIVGEAFLKEAKVYRATNFQSGIFLSGPSAGGFAFHPLPRLAQFSPIYGMVAADFDGDGNEDLFGVQNSYAPIPSVGRFDGGLGILLLGDGEGGFEPLLPGECGILVTGDGKAACLIDFNDDARPDVLLSRNHSSLLAYENEAVESSGRFYCVELRGAQANPHAVGARVAAKFSDGGSSVKEVYAGSGYMSQSSPRVFLSSARDNALSEIRVRWPDGDETLFTGPFPEGAVLLSRPR